MAMPQQQKHSFQFRKHAKLNTLFTIKTMEVVQVDINKSGSGDGKLL